MPLKITVISGFLGSGKSTLIKTLLENNVFGYKPVLIENDCGALDIDETVIDKSGVIIKELNAGCICCSPASDFTRFLGEIVYSYNPEHLIIESSGVSKLSDILRVMQSSSFYDSFSITRTRTVTVINLQKFWHNDKYVPEYFWNQIRGGEILLLTKPGNMSCDEIGDICAYIRAHHSTGIILKDLNPITIEKIKRQLAFSSHTPMILMRTVNTKKTRISGFY